jgi:hypothetical protein
MVDIKQLNDFMIKAINLTPNCIFVLDTVYIGLLEKNKSK